MRKRYKVGLSVEQHRPQNAQGSRWDRPPRIPLLSLRKGLHPRPRHRQHQHQPLLRAKRHRRVRQTLAILSALLRARLRQHRRIHLLPDRRPFVRKGHGTARQERRPRLLLRSPRENSGPAGMLLPQGVQHQQRQGSIARPGRKCNRLPQVLCPQSKARLLVYTPARQELRREGGKQRRCIRRREALLLSQQPPANKRV